MQAPVTKRSAGAAIDAGSMTKRSAFAPAPIAADTAKNRRGSSLSASPMSALARQPATKPACTPLVSAALEKLERWNSAASAGSTADAENQSAIAATWQNAMIAIDAGFDCASRLKETAPPAARGPHGRRSPPHRRPSEPTALRATHGCRRRVCRRDAAARATQLRHDPTLVVGGCGHPRLVERAQGVFGRSESPLRLREQSEMERCE